MPVNLTDPISLQVNDPTDNMVDSVPIPPYTAEMPFMVIGFDGGGREADTYAGRAATCYYVLATAVPNAVARWGKTPKWPATAELLVQPAGGKMLNAYYDRRALQFFFSWDPPRNKYVYTSGGIDVIAHELGHALLDSVRPDFWDFAIPEVAALHESFGDLHGLTTTMKRDRVLTRALIETGGNVRRSNIISRVAEEMGTAQQRLPLGQVGTLRDAANGFAYAKPSTLPADGPNSVLTSEPHSFSRVFTGAVYEVMSEIYFALVSNGVDGLVALRRAGETIQDYFFAATLTVPASTNLFENFAKAMMVADSQRGGAYQSLMRAVFERRLVVPPLGLRALSRGEDAFETLHKSEEIKVSELGVGALAAGHPLSDVVVKVPLDEWRRYNAAGDLVDEHLPDRDSVRDSAMRFVGYLHKNDRIGHGKEFDVVDDRLVRNHIACA